MVPTSAPIRTPTRGATGDAFLYAIALGSNRWSRHGPPPATIRAALAAVGLAGSIVQFVSFSTDILSKSREIHRSASDTTEENVDFAHVSRDLKSLREQLQKASTGSETLSELAERCLRTSDELSKALKELKGKGKLQAPASQNTARSYNSSTAKWTSFRRALKALWGKQRVKDLVSRLEGLRDQVAFHLISDQR